MSNRFSNGLLKYSDTISYAQHHDFGKLVSKRKEHQYRKTNYTGIRDNRNPILMAGPYIKQDLRYQRELTPGVYRDHKAIFDKEDKFELTRKKAAGQCHKTINEENLSSKLSVCEWKPQIRTAWSNTMASLLHPDQSSPKSGLDLPMAPPGNMIIHEEQLTVVPLKRTRTGGNRAGTRAPSHHHRYSLAGEETLAQYNTHLFRQKRHYNKGPLSVSQDFTNFQEKFYNKKSMDRIQRPETSRYNKTHGALNDASTTLQDYKRQSMSPFKARRNTGDFKDVISYGYASHRADHLTDKITNVGISRAGSKHEVSVVDLTGVDDLEIYVDRSIREGYTGRAVPKRYHEYKNASKVAEARKVRPQNYVSDRPAQTAVQTPTRVRDQYRTVTNNPTPERLR